MPVYNSQRYVAEAIESVLKQTYENFEFLVFDDGSTDNSKDIIAGYALQDKRIIPFYADENTGYVFHLNNGIRLAKGSYIARMDSDDISLKDRFALQTDFLNKHQRVAVVGTSTIIIGEDGNELGVDRRNTSSAGLLWQSFFTNPLAHPTVMFRKSEILKAGLYNPLKMPAEDFELWTRVLKASNVANLGLPLVKYRMHAQSVSKTRRDAQRDSSMQTLKDHWSAFCQIEISDELGEFFKNYHKGFEFQSFDKIRTAYYLIAKLYVRIVRQQGFSAHVERDAFNKLYYLVARSSRFSAVVFVELLSLTVLLFPIRTFRKLIWTR